MEHAFYILTYNTYLAYIFPFYLIATGGREGVSPIASYNIKESVVFGGQKARALPLGWKPRAITRALSSSFLFYKSEMTSTSCHYYVG